MDLPMPAAPPAPPRRLVAAGFIRRTTGRVLTLDATGTRVTGTIRKAGAR
ncbi:hypothetical protein ABZ608_41520 [Streptomyces sp. NPDC013172]|uniref:Uncharacterized protein n=1 Tax=Streptomyces atriruber TaxID=545121 RepID=A0ABV3C126_9ACTN